jgi:hypothetical protein
LTRDALRRAEAQLAEEMKGVRDEIGFLLCQSAPNLDPLSASNNDPFSGLSR